MEKYFHCGCCEQYHHVNYFGDCRNDAHRFNPEDLDKKHGLNEWEEVDYPDIETV